LENNREIHRGAILHAVAKRQKKTIIKIAKDAGYEKSSIFKHFRQKDLPLEILYKYATTIPHHFEIEIPEMADYLEQNGLKIEETRKLTYEELQRQSEEWKDRFYKLLEEHQKLLKP
jgi:tRNA(Phe) wybutosine-synthesizing methylase Tyw3